MSLADDADFCAAVVEQSSKIIATQVGKLQTKLNAERKERQVLQKRVEGLEAELEDMKRTLEQLQIHNCESACQKAISQGFTAALVAVTPTSLNQGQSIQCQHGNQMVFSALFDAVLLIPNISGPMASTPTDSTHSTKRARTEATSQIIDQMDFLPEEFKNKIQPFYKVDNQASHDKLNHVQRAFVKFKAHQLHSARETPTPSFVHSVIQEGIDERFWQPDFNPGQHADIEKYLINRLKNERKALRRRDSLKNQSKLVEKYIEDSLQTNQDE